jgi:hypothetical protein
VIGVRVGPVWGHYRCALYALYAILSEPSCRAHWVIDEPFRALIKLKGIFLEQIRGQDKHERSKFDLL